MVRLIATMIFLFAGAAWAAGPPDAATWERFGKIEEAEGLSRRGIALYRAGKLVEATAVLTRAVAIREGLYPHLRFPQGHPDLAVSLNNLGFMHQSQGEYAKAEPIYERALEVNEAMYPRARFPHGHPALASSLNNLAGLHFYRGDHAKAEPLFARCLAMREALYPRALFPQGHPDLATSLNNLASSYNARSEDAKAVPLYARALAMREALYPKTQYPQGHPHLATSLNNMGAMYRSRADHAKAEPFYARALAMNEALYPKTRFPLGHPELAQSLNNMASLHESQDDQPEAEAHYRRAVEMYERLFPKARYPAGHPGLATSLSNLAFLYQSQGDYTKAEPLCVRAVEMRERLYPRTQYPKGHPDLAGSLNNLAFLLHAQGDSTKAVPLCVRALKMREGLFPEDRYPRGHPFLAQSLNNLAGLHLAAGDDAKAELLYARVLKMQEGLYPKTRYPDGHPELALALNNLGGPRGARGDLAKAEQFYARALEMRERLYPRDRYPKGHHDLLVSLNNLGMARYFRGDYARAEPPCERALEMAEALYPRGRYPQGHPDLAMSLSNRAFLHDSRGEYAKAEPLFGRALRMVGDSAVSLAAASSETMALNYLASQPLARDAYLSVANRLPGTDAYPAVWQSKAALTRVAQRRHHAVLAASSGEARDLWDAVRSLRRERAGLLLARAAPTRAAARDARLDEIDGEISKKQDALRSLLPALKRSHELTKAAPPDLQEALPPHHAFVDLLRYARSEQDAKVPGEKGRKSRWHYVAFVITRGAIVRVELGAAGPIEEALGLWRRAIDEGSASHAKYAGLVGELVWAPLAKHLAPAKTVYLCPDMDLSSLPWAALPGRLPGTILLEDHTLATVPHGPFLLDQLTAKREKAPAKPTVLAMGGVSYDETPASSTSVASLRGPLEGKGLWPRLAGTAAEVASLSKTPGDRNLIALTGDKAGIAALLDELPRADVAHLATHGYFADKKFRSVLQLDEKLFERLGGERSSAGSRSPMLLSGLVCAGANLAGTPNRGIVTADAIVGLDLRRLNLAVLSACETGLGDVAGGEGVFGLQRAFHVAGARNVVASLWKVDDEATAALMKIFYNNLWAEKMNPAEAMRQAQLAVYRSPGSVKEWAARGPLPRPVAGPARSPVKGARVASPKVYAAFVVSGVAR